MAEFSSKDSLPSITTKNLKFMKEARALNEDEVKATGHRTQNHLAPLHTLSVPVFVTSFVSLSGSRSRPRMTVLVIFRPTSFRWRASISLRLFRRFCQITIKCKLTRRLT